MGMALEISEAKHREIAKGFPEYISSVVKCAKLFLPVMRMSSEFQRFLRIRSKWRKHSENAPKIWTQAPVNTAANIVPMADGIGRPDQSARLISDW